MGTVSADEADRLFRQVFGGRSVKEVLRDAADRDACGALVDHGLYGACVRRSKYNELLREAQHKADIQRLLGDAEKTEVVTREKLTTDDGKGFVKVKTVTYWRDGRI